MDCIEVQVKWIIGAMYRNIMILPINSEEDRVPGIPRLWNYAVVRVKRSRSRALTMYGVLRVNYWHQFRGRGAGR